MGRTSSWSIIRIIIEDEYMIHEHPHPGEILKDTVIAPLEISVTEAAERLAMSRVALSRVLNGRAGISADLALRLEQAGVSTARFWMNLQANYDLWLAMQRRQPPVRALRVSG
jgi:addiction module HigA family antidote